jgi:hypothetical protein
MKSLPWSSKFHQECHNCKRSFWRRKPDTKYMPNQLKPCSRMSLFCKALVYMQQPNHVWTWLPVIRSPVSSYWLATVLLTPLPAPHTSPHHPAQSTYIYIESTTLYVPSSELGLPQHFSRQRVCPSPQNRGGGGHTRLRVGLGEFQFRRLEKKLSTLPTLWSFYSVS